MVKYSCVVSRRSNPPFFLINIHQWCGDAFGQYGERWESIYPAIFSDDDAHVKFLFKEEADASAFMFQWDVVVCEVLE
jgi:hypothetical protein